MENRKSLKRPSSQNSESRNKKPLTEQNSSNSITLSSNPTPLLDVSNLLLTIKTFVQQNNESSLIELQNEMINLLPQNETQNDIVLKSDPDAKTTESRIVTNTVLDLIDPELLTFLKEHQRDAIKFLFDRVIGKNGNIINKRSGAMLAHNMGLGKSFTIIAFLHTVLSNDNMNQIVSKVLIVCPKNIIDQWKSEVQNWINCPGRRLADNITITCIDGPSKSIRFYDVKSWYEKKDKKQILIMGYEMYGILVKEGDDFIKFLQNPGPDLVVFDEAHRLKNKETQGYKLAAQIKTARIILLTGTPLQNNLMEFYNGLHLISPLKEGDDFKKFLQNPGPDLVVFDEAHRLKNKETQGYKLAAQIKTARIILLTGTPLQNNLMEFYNGLRLISPRLFTSEGHFKRFFADRIERGRSKDASAAEVKDMQVLCKLLYKRTKRVVHRKGVEVLIEQVGVKKIEATFMVRPSKIQKDLIEAYLNRIDPDTGNPPRKSAVKDHPVISRIATHPSLFHEYAKETKSSSIERMDFDFKRINKNKVILKLSNKLMLLIKIIKYSQVLGDKILVFSQSLIALNFIEKYLNNLSDRWKKLSKTSWGWEKGIDYFRIDGGVDSSSRHAFQNIFNDPLNPQCRLMLISTKAGSLGTNMVGANRVVIFDACWNPTHDIQSLYRVYRLGQTKPVYIYRLVTSGTMEEVVYNRQITKEATCHRSLGTNMVGANRVVIFDACWNPTHDIQSLYRVYRLGQTKPVYIYRLVTSGTMEEVVYNRQITKEATCHRVVDEEDINRHFTHEELKHLYRFNYVSANEPTLIVGNFDDDPLIYYMVKKYPKALVEVVSHNSFFDEFNENEVSESDVNQYEEKYEKEMMMKGEYKIKYGGKCPNLNPTKPVFDASYANKNFYNDIGLDLSDSDSEDD
uniref:Uncharacterized protein n=1 Tax=Panagrolaimus sp. ES5 TaxID=591445 RepID=A0AC34F4H8_9BILA